MKPQDGTLLPDDTLLSDVILTARAEHVARFAEPPIRTVGDLRKMSNADLLKLGDCGKMTLLEFRLLTGQYQAGKTTLSDRVVKQQWVRAIASGTCECSFEKWRKEQEQ